MKRNERRVTARVAAAVIFFPRNGGDDGQRFERRKTKVRVRTNVCVCMCVRVSVWRGVRVCMRARAGLIV